MYTTEQSLVSKEEIAGIIFNSAHFVLDDLLAKCTNVGFSVCGLISRLADDINNRHERELTIHTTAFARREFLEV